MSIAFLNCRLGRHEPLRRNVAKDGGTYVGQCRHCQRDIERVGPKTWKAQKA